MKASRIPAWLLTGYLGSGKTTLLAAWLRDPALADAALVINEIGAVGLDDRLLANAVSSASPVANACVCCTSLPGLEEALAGLFWDRLQRRRPAFGHLMIETSGRADPRNVMAAFERVPLLVERYYLAGVIATASATAGLALIETHAEARAQIASADAIIVTKTDQAAGEPLAAALRALNPRASIALSGVASNGPAAAARARPSPRGCELRADRASHDAGGAGRALRRLARRRAAAPERRRAARRRRAVQRAVVARRRRGQRDGFRG